MQFFTLVLLALVSFSQAAVVAERSRSPRSVLTADDAEDTEFRRRRFLGSRVDFLSGSRNPHVHRGNRGCDRAAICLR